MGSCITHLNYFLPRAAGVNFWFFMAVPSGGGCWYKAKCEMRDAATQNRHRNECAKLRIFHEIAKWRRWRHASWLMATAVVTDSRCPFSKRWHVADVKNIAGDDQATLMVERNSANIAYTFRFYVFTSTRSQLLFCGWRERQLPWTRVVVFRCQHQKLHWRWPGNPNGRSKFRKICLFTFTRSQLTMLRRRLCGWRPLPEIAQTAHSQHQKHHRQWPGSIEIPHLWIFMLTRSSKTSKKTSLCC